MHEMDEIYVHDYLPKPLEAPVWEGSVYVIRN